MSEYPKFPSIARLNKPVVITEKIDGTNAQVFIADSPGSLPLGATGWQSGEHVVAAGSRNRWLTPEKDNFAFAQWVWGYADELVALLGEGQHFGEWWGPGIQRGYGLASRKFSLFNVGRWTELEPTGFGLDVVPTLGTFQGNDLNAGVNSCMEQLEALGSIASPGFMSPEGVVVYHTAAKATFKQTFDNDGGKWTS